jgi:hypothetical protein
MGKLALASRRMGTHLRDRNHHAERALRGNPQSHAGDPEARGLAGMAGRATRDEATLKSLLAPYPSDGSLRVGNVNNNDPSLIEPIALP